MSAGAITGPLLAYEVLTAFFLEAGFLGVMLFGWNKVGPELHFFATLMVALGTLDLGNLDSGGRTAGCRPRRALRSRAGASFRSTGSKVIFNPSFPYRLIHMAIAAYLATALFVGAAGAWHLLRGTTPRGAHHAFDGDVDGGRRRADPDRRRRPAWPQHAAISARQDRRDRRSLAQTTGRGRAADPVRLARHGGRDDRIRRRSPSSRQPHPDPRPGTANFAASSEFPPQDRPNSTIMFWTFRIMVGLGLLMLAQGLWGLVLRWRGGLYESRIVPALRRADGAGRNHRDPGGMVDHGNRPPALGGLWRHAHRRRRVANHSALAAAPRSAFSS